MKKRITQKVLATVAVACLFVAGAWAQGTNLPGDGANFATNWADNTTDAHMVAGTTIPLFAMPDPYYHPNYNPGTEVYTLTAGFIWHWTVPAGLTLVTANDANDNYATISGGTAGNTYIVNVAERSPAAWGACDDGGQDINVIVHATPDATLGATLTYEECEGGAGLPAAVNATISDGWQNYWLVWNLEIKTLDNAGNDDDFYDTDKTALAALAEEYTTASPDKTATAAGAYDITSIAGGFTCINNQTTVYTYELTSINDRALRFGDFIARGGSAADASLFTYNAIGETLTVTVHPTPVTGPLYHINNSWAD
ncbi:MAG: hypothetical protein R6X09_04170 [Bacteroidales bacterium]